MARFEREQSEYIEKLVYLNRVSKTVKGGRVIAAQQMMQEIHQQMQHRKFQLYRVKMVPVHEALS